MSWVITCSLLSFIIYLFLLELLVSSDLSRHTDLATWIFERVVLKPNFEPFFSVALSEDDNLQVIISFY